jgi:hypothetical protein
LDVTSRLAIWKKFFELADYKVLDENPEDAKDVVLKKDLEELARRPFNGE